MALTNTARNGDNGAIDESAVFGALYACAANPENWDQLVSVLKPEPGNGDDPLALEAIFARQLSRAEDLAWRLSEPDRLTIKDAAPPVPFAYLALAEGRRILGFNDLFVRQLGALLGKVVRGGRLKIDNSENEDDLTDAIRRLNRAAASGRTALHLKDATGDTWHVGYLVQSGTLPPAIRRSLSNDLGGEPNAHVLLFPGEPTHRLALDVVQKGFGLTPAEARLAVRLKDGLSISESAELLGVSVNTARNQLRSIFQKIGVNRQSELVRSLTHLSTFAARIWATEDVADRPPAEPIKTPDQQLLRLPHGRRLAFRCYGPEHGRAVLAFHEGVGSSLLMSDSWATVAAHNIRLFAVERPGFGLSDPAPEYTFDSVATDMVAFLDAMKIRDVALIGFVSGAAFALATALKLGPRATRVVICSGRPPGDTARDLSGPGKLWHQFRHKMTTHPWLVDTFFTIMRARLSHATVHRMIRMSGGVTPDDLAFIDRNPDVIDYIAAYIGESLAVSARGVADELRCFARGGVFDISGLTCAVIAHHGAEDGLVPLARIKAFLETCPNVDLKVHAGAGHLLGFRIVNDLLIAIGT